MKKHRFRFTIYSGVLAVILLLLAFQGKKPEKEIMFDEDSRVNIYIHAEAGEEPKIDPAEFYPDLEGLDLTLFEWDLSGCSPDQPGTCEVPVFYDGKQTNAVLCIEREEAQERSRLPETKDREGHKTQELFKERGE